MPTYDYGCKKCGHTFERFLSMSDSDQPLTELCPACGEYGGIERVISSAPPLVSGLGVGKNVVPSGFKDVLKNIKDKHHGSKINIP